MCLAPQSVIPSGSRSSDLSPRTASLVAIGQRRGVAPERGDAIPLAPMSSLLIEYHSPFVSETRSRFDKSARARACSDDRLSRSFIRESPGVG